MAQPWQSPDQVVEFVSPDAPNVAGEVLLTVDNLNVTFRGAGGGVHAVRGVSYDVRRGETLGIVGESGSGKSVTSMAVMGLLDKSARVSGSVKFKGDELLGLKDKVMSDVRGKKIAMIFQDPMTSLNPVHRIGAQIAEAIVAKGEVGKG
ncbi:MAG: glutathione transport system ATP-binding protein, partial [Pseudonocardiales bacterium]|nr:glutathione transport system ATP-binding protein [Pseudonocardiales bacterium]